MAISAFEDDTVMLSCESDNPWPVKQYKDSEILKDSIKCQINNDGFDYGLIQAPIYATKYNKIETSAKVTIK